MKKVLLLITALLTAPGLVSADLWDELSHDANSVSHAISHQTNVLVHKDIPAASHVINHQAHVAQTKDLPVVGHAITKEGKAVGHFVLSNVATACRMAMGKAVGTVIGMPCPKAVSTFAIDCNVELDEEAPEVGITACTVASTALTMACKHELTQAVAGNAIHQACDHLAD